MQITSLAIPEVKLIQPKRFGDLRGFFMETYSKVVLSDHGIDIDFVQDNQSLSPSAGTVRGLHFQNPPHAQTKLVRVTRGRVFDVAVDLRLGSPTYGRHVSAELSASNGTQILVPIGFAHGLMTLEPDTEVIYKVCGPYAPSHDAGLAWNDPVLDIPWPKLKQVTILSDKDANLPRFGNFESPFAYLV